MLGPSSVRTSMTSSAAILTLPVAPRPPPADGRSSIAQAARYGAQSVRTGAADRRGVWQYARRAGGAVAPRSLPPRAETPPLPGPEADFVARRPPAATSVARPPPHGTARVQPHVALPDNATFLDTLDAPSVSSDNGSLAPRAPWSRR